MDGSERYVEVKSAAVPWNASSLNSKIDEAYDQIKGAPSALQGEIHVDLSKVDLSRSENLNSQAAIENRVNGKMTDERLRGIDRLEVRYVDPEDGVLKSTLRERDVDGLVQPVRTEDL